MKKIVSLLSVLFFLTISNSLLAEVDIEFLKQKYPKCEDQNYRDECFDDAKKQTFLYIGYFRDNSLWDGQYFENDVLVFEFVNGERITKMLCEEKKDGWFVCPSGTRYRPIEGGYIDKNNLQQGKFIVEFFSGNKFIGEHKDGEEHGQGTFTWTFGDKYIGKYRKGKYHGQGTYTYADGSKEEGEWQNGTLNGYAIQYNADGGIIREGIFKNDKFLYAKTREKEEPSKIEKYKSTCEEIGFTPGTEKFGDCVMKLMDKI